MATVTPGYTFTNNEIVTPAKLNSAATPAISSISTDDISDGAITQVKLNSNIILVPPGAVMPFATTTVPTGWLHANGAAVSRTTYADLFASIGTTFGAGNGSTTFNLPDLRGYFVRGYGTNSNGVASGGFGAKQADAITAHTHTTNSQGSHFHYATAAVTGATEPFNTININSAEYIAARAQSGAGTPDWSYNLNGVGNTPNAGRTNTEPAHNHTTNSQSPAGATETRPDNIALLYCIKY